MKIALTQLSRRGFSPSGSRLSRHRHPRMACASMPNGIERIIHPQCISLVSAVRSALISVSRYIHNSIAAARIMDRLILMAVARLMAVGLGVLDDGEGYAVDLLKEVEGIEVCHA